MLCNKILLCIVAFSVSLCAQTLVGEAVDCGDHSLKYREVRGPVLGNCLHTDYFDAQGKILQQKDDCLASNTEQPSYHFIHLPTGMTVDVQKKGPSLLTKIVKNGEIKTWSMEANSGDVWDVGIHYWILDHWNLLIKEEQEVNLYVPEKNQSVNFVVRKIYGDSQKVRFELVTANYFYRLFLHPIQVEYSLANHQMLSYEGISDVKDSKGKNMQVCIRYSPKG